MGKLAQPVVVVVPGVTVADLREQVFLSALGTAHQSAWAAAYSVVTLLWLSLTRWQQLKPLPQARRDSNLATTTYYLPSDLRSSKRTR